MPPSLTRIFVYFLTTLVQVPWLCAVNPDITITHFDIFGPSNLVYYGITGTSMLFNAKIANIGAMGGDLDRQSTDGDNIALKLYLSDNAQFENATSDWMQQGIMVTDGNIDVTINAGSFYDIRTGVRGRVYIPDTWCPTHNYLCLRAEPIDDSFIDGNMDNNDLCLMFGPQSDGKVGEKACKTDMSVEESKYGVIVVLNNVSLESRWPTIVTEYRSTVADMVNTYCNFNSNFKHCCPGYGSKRGTNTVNIVSAADVGVGMGYPIQSGDNLSVMTLVRPKADNDLCQLGSSSRRRRGVMSANQPLLYRIRRQTDSFYLAQSVLQESLRERQDDFMVGVKVTSITPTRHLGNDNIVLPIWLLVIIIVCCVLIIAVISAVVYLAFPTRNKNPFVYIYD